MKIRGHRVEPAEVETLLRAHPTVAQAAVVADAYPNGGLRLLAYVTSPSPLPAEPGELLGYLRRQLPDHAVPHQVVVLEEMPVGTMGKLDRSSLPPPPAEEADADSDQPRSVLERALSGICCEILDLASFGVRQNFIRSGGD